MTFNNSAKVEPLLEDSVESLFFSSSAGDNLSWDNLCSQLNSTIQSISASYVWHRDEFKVHIPIALSRDNEIPNHIASITCIGDNIEDEWFIVYIVMELSKQYEDLIVQIRDADGDFLLIEAADHLPSWANPDTTDNRVFIHQGKVHIIPPNLQSDNELKLVDAIKIIAEAPEKTKASNNVQHSILQRIGDYPEKILESYHRAVVKLPVDIAALLAMKPYLIAPLVNTYCNHDIIDVKACKTINYEQQVTVCIQFTKCLYAMLMHAKPFKNVKFKEINDKKSVLGHKLTAGYQILMNRQSLDVYSSKQFQHFMTKLNASGYFKNNIEGSKDYNELLKNAKEFYLVMECPINSQVSNEISNLKSSEEFAQIKESLLQNISSNKEIIEDNDDWLNINPDQLNDILNSRYGKKVKFNNSDILTANNVTSELSSFLMRTSDFEGIETSRCDTSKNVEFDPDDFVNSVQKMLDMITIGEEAGSDSDEDHFDCEDDIEENDEVLNGFKEEGLQDSKAILHNIVQSMKEEGLTGPSSNLMKSAGFNKTEFLDSDDDE